MKGPRPARMPVYGAGSKYLGRTEKKTEWRRFHAPQVPGNSHCAPTTEGVIPVSPRHSAPLQEGVISIEGPDVLRKTHAPQEVRKTRLCAQLLEIWIPASGRSCRNGTFLIR